MPLKYLQKKAGINKKQIYHKIFNDYFQLLPVLVVHL